MPYRNGTYIAVDHLPSAVQEREAVKVVLSLNGPVTAVIVLKVPAVDQVTVIFAVAVCDLAHIGPVISACAVVLVKNCGIRCKIRKITAAIQ